MKIRTKLQMSFGACISIFLLVVGASYVGLEYMRHQITEVIERDGQLIRNSHEIMNHVVDMEMGQRNFVVTGRDSFLEPYHRAVGDIEKLMADQRELIRNDAPQQLQRLDNVNQLVQQWHDDVGLPEIQIRRALAQRQSHESRMKNMVLSGQGKAVFDQLRKTVDPILGAFRRDGNVAATLLASDFEKAMVDQETGLRGYLLTGNEEFLEPFHSGKKDATDALSQLHVIVDTAHDREATQDNIQQVRQLFEQWFEHIHPTNKSMPVDQAPGTVSTPAMIDRHYNEIMDELTVMMDDFQHTQNDTLFIATAKTSTSLTAVAKQLRQWMQSGDNNTEQKLYQAKEHFSQSLENIAKINANAYNIDAMRQSLNSLDLIAKEWLNTIALPEIKARRDMDASPQTLGTLAKQLAIGEDQHILIQIRNEIEAFIQVEDARLEQRVKKTSTIVSLIENIEILIGLGAIVIASILSVTFTKMIADPIRRLSAGLDAISKGDRTLRVDVRSHDELGYLAKSFNNMADQLQSLEEDREASTEALSEAKEKAEAANRSKSEFLANMSHEIRTPMNAILGFADLLEDEDLNQNDRKEYIQTVRRNGDHLMHILNDILDLSKIESGKMGIEKIAVDLNELISDATSLMRPRATGKGLTLQVDYESQLPRQVLTDPVRLRQILLNLLGNAIKFTEQGGVRLVVSTITSSVANHTGLCFKVIDSGIGISPQQIERLFKPFSQADESMSRRFGGTGLGLTLSKRFATMLGGDLKVQSKPGQGSEFHATIHAGLQQEQAAPAGAVVMPKSASSLGILTGRVLLAEDGKDNQRLIMFHLKKMGLVVDFCENGQDAMRTALAQRDAGTPYDAILMDMQMPVMDGYTATTRLREQGYTGPIIALTAHAMAGDREKCLDAGCDEYTTKPIDKAAIHALLGAMLEPCRAA